MLAEKTPEGPSPSTCWRSATSRTPTAAAWSGARRWRRRWAGSAPRGPCYLTRTTRTRRRPSAGSSSSRAPGSTGWSQAARRAVHPERPHHVQGQARADRRRGRRRLPRAQDSPRPSGRCSAACCSASTTTRDSSSTSASAPASPRRGGPSSSRSCSPWSARSRSTLGPLAGVPHRQPRPGAGHPEPLEPGQGPLVHATAPRAGGRGRLRAHGGAAVPAHRALQALARGPRPRVVRLRAARGDRLLRPG